MAEVEPRMLGTLLSPPEGFEASINRVFMKQCPPDNPNVILTLPFFTQTAAFKSDLLSKGI